MDRHDVPGATPEDAANAHTADLEVAKHYDVQFISYWLDEEKGAVFCFAKAPTRDVISEIHAKSHGLIPNKIIDVSQDDVFKFLGSVTEPKKADEITSPLRTVLFTDLVSSTEMLDSIGETAFLEIIRAHDGVVRESLYRHSGREVKHTGDGIMASFTDALNAVNASVDMTAAFADLEPHHGYQLKVRVGLASGRPVDHNDDIYGETVVLASRLCDAANPQQVLAAESVKSHAGRSEVFAGPSMRRLKGFAEPVAVYEVASGGEKELGMGSLAPRRWWHRLLGSG